MYLTLFNIGGYVVVPWALMIFLPTWRGTRALARSGIVPALVAMLYVIGIVSLIGHNGFGFIREFGTADGVARLMAQRDIALVAWIHFLAFDQLVGIFIYRDNMHHRYVPIPVQSVILFLTFMLGPLGFVSYYVIRWARAGSPGGRTEEARP
jgi:ABA4-like protein